MTSATSAQGLERSSAAEGGGDWIRAAPAQAGIERIEGAFAGPAYDPHRHDTYAIGYTIAGVQSFDYRGARADSLPGHTIVLHPDETHDGYAGSEAGFRYRMLYLAPETISDALGDRARALPFVPESAAPDPILLAALRPAFEAMDQPLEALQLDAVVEAIAGALLRRARSARGKPASPACVRAVRRARAYLDAHCTDVVGSDELERVSGLGRYELTRHFRARVGTSPYRYLTMRRLDRMQAAIRAGTPLAEAAAAAGFADQAHMTRQFRKAFGVSPGRWRALTHHAGSP